MGMFDELIRLKDEVPASVWELLWCLNNVTATVETSDEVLGIVNEGKAVSSLFVAEALGKHLKNARRNLKQLEERGFLHLTRADYGFYIKVRYKKIPSLIPAGGE